MSSVPPGPAAVRRLRIFTATVWVFGLSVILLVGAVTLAGLPRAMDSSAAAAGEDAYRYTPWENPHPTLAVDEGAGVYSGGDGDMIPLDGIDPAQPLRVEVLDDTMVFDISVTGPGGAYEIGGALGPPRFSDQDYGTDSFAVLAPGDRAELWVGGPSAKNWRVRVSRLDLPAATDIVSGIGPQLVRYAGAATTARVSGRGDGYLSIVAVTRSGSEPVLEGQDRFDRSMAWADSQPVVFVVTGSRGAAWSIAFDEPAPTPSASTDATQGGGANG